MYPTFFHWHTKHVLIQKFFLMISRLRIAWFLMVCMTVYKYARIVLVTFIFARCSHAIRSNKKISHLKALFICIDCIIYVLGRFNKTKGMRGFFFLALDEWFTLPHVLSVFIIAILAFLNINLNEIEWRHSGVWCLHQSENCNKLSILLWQTLHSQLTSNSFIKSSEKIYARYSSGNRRRQFIFNEEMSYKHSRYRTTCNYQRRHLIL